MTACHARRTRFVNDWLASRSMWSTQSFLLGDNRIATATSGRCRYRHTFGGPHDRKGASREDCNGLLIHLLHRLDLTDPAIPIAIPGVRWLPLYYCFDFRTTDLGYRLLSEKAMVAYFHRDAAHVTKHEAWPADDYPPQFAKSSIRIDACDYDPTDLEDVYAWAGVFGIGKLSKRDQSAAKKRVAEETEGLGLEVPETEREFHEALSNPFVQGIPTGRCLNPECPNRRKRRSLSTIALIPAEPVKGVHMFGPWCDDVQLIVQMCGRCYAIRVTNQCT